MRRRLDSEKNTKSRKMITLCNILPPEKKRKVAIDKGERTWYNDARGNYTCRFFCWNSSVGTPSAEGVQTRNREAALGASQSS